MVIFKNIEEHFCSECKQNVGIEYTHMDDGTTIKRCLSKTCGNNTEQKNCFFNSLD